MPQATTCLLRRGQTILFDGDSLTSRRLPGCLDHWPYLRLSNWHQTYAERVEEWLFCNRPDLRLTFHNAAVGGSTCHDLLEHFESCGKQCRPAWVILTLGGNDVNRKVPLSEFAETFATYCQRVTEAGGRVMGLGGFVATPHAPEALVATRRAAVSYYQTMRRVLTRCGGVYLNVGQPLARRARLLYRQHPIHTIYSDGGHFNAVANEIIAMQVLQALGVIQLTPA